MRIIRITRRKDMKELIRFKPDGKEIKINTELLKKMFFGSNKEAIK